jgi:acid-sensing ion channel 2
MSQIQVSNQEILTNFEKDFNKTQNELEEDTKRPKLSDPIKAVEQAQKNNNVKVKNLIKETLYNSVAQAIIKIIETPYFTLKIFLFISVIASSGICSCLIIQLIMGYLSYGVSTTSRTSYETPATFPKVTICNVNPFTTQYAVEYLKKMNQEYDNSIDIFDEVQMSKLDFETKYKLLGNIYWRGIYKMNGLNETEKRKLSHPLEEILVICSFNAQSCDANDFTWYFDPHNGNCWIYNSGQNRTGQRVPLSSNSFPGVIYGLRTMFYVNFCENLTSFNSFMGGGFGALVRIDNSSYLTDYGYDGIAVAPGYYTSISISRSFKSSLPKPYSNCLIDNQTNAGFHSELFDLIQNSPYRYTQPICFLQCQQKYIYLKCNCTDPSVTSLFLNVSQCLTLEKIKCMGNLYETFLFTNDFIQEKCLSECPFECYFDNFDASLNSFELIPNAYMEFLNSRPSLLADFSTNKIDLNVAKQSFVFINTFYKSLSYETFIESPQTNLVWLFASIGGYLGLFLGISVFSVFEPIQVLIEILFLKLSNRINIANSKA